MKKDTTNTTMASTIVDNFYNKDKSLLEALNARTLEAVSTAINIEHVDHPIHYGGRDNPYEAIKVIRAWDLGFSLGNTIKYISRAGKKDPSKRLEDLRKAMWYLEEEISNEVDRSSK